MATLYWTSIGRIELIEPYPVQMKIAQFRKGGRTFSGVLFMQLLNCSIFWTKKWQYYSMYDNSLIEFIQLIQTLQCLCKYSDELSDTCINNWTNTIYHLLPTTPPPLMVDKQIKP
jgi:hypothetical protein